MSTLTHDVDWVLTWKDDVKYCEGVRVGVTHRARSQHAVLEAQAADVQHADVQQLKDEEEMSSV